MYSILIFSRVLSYFILIDTLKTDNYWRCQYLANRAHGQNLVILISTVVYSYLYDSITSLITEQQNEDSKNLGKDVRVVLK